MKTATFVRVLKTWRGDARLYRVEPPMPWSEGSEKGGVTFYIAVSVAVVSPTGRETYVFPMDSSGEPLSWQELPGSCRGEVSHVEMLRYLGYAAEESVVKREGQW